VLPTVSGESGAPYAGPANTATMSSRMTTCMLVLPVGLDFE
jgi:hypothetical protein